MPTYEYKCKKCGVFENFQSISSEPLKKCPTCGAKVQKMVTSCMAPIFKGSGFYATDYKNKIVNEKFKPAPVEQTAPKSADPED